MNDVRLEALRRAIQDGIISGPAEHLDMTAIKAEARSRKHGRLHAVEVRTDRSARRVMSKDNPPNDEIP